MHVMKHITFLLERATKKKNGSQLLLVVRICIIYNNFSPFLTFLTLRNVEFCYTKRYINFKRISILLQFQTIYASEVILKTSLLFILN